MQDSVIEYLSKRGWSSSSDVSRALSINQAEARTALQALVSAGKVMKRGKKRGTKYAVGTSTVNSDGLDSIVLLDPNRFSNISEMVATAILLLPEGQNYTVIELANAIFEFCPDTKFTKWEIITTTRNFVRTEKNPQGTLLAMRANDGGNRILYRRA